MAKFNSAEVAAWSIFSLPFSVLHFSFLMPSPFGGMPDSCMGFFPWASHTTSAFMVIFPLLFETVCKCVCWLLKQIQWTSPVYSKILLTENNYLRHNVCWENISQEVKMKTQLPCKSVWSLVLIKCFYWEETYGIVWYPELMTQMQQAKGITSRCCMSACTFISKHISIKSLK